MSVIKPPIDMSTRTSASAVDADKHLQGQDAAQAEQDRIDQWTKPGFAMGGQHQLQMYPSFGHRVRGRK